MKRTIGLLVLYVFFLGQTSVHCTGITLSNNTIQVLLDCKDGAPVINQCSWIDDGSEIFRLADQDTSNSFWPIVLPEDANPVWQIAETGKFKRAELTGALKNGVSIHWSVEIPKQESILRFQVRLTNPHGKSIDVDWFPIWNGAWSFQDTLHFIRWWDALSYRMHVDSPANLGELILSSKVQSSDTPGNLPYWLIDTPNNHLFFGLEWTGGWKTVIQGDKNQAEFQCMLPPDETQLTLLPNESIDGPVLNVFLSREKDENRVRQDIMAKRMSLARLLYDIPEPSFPLVYNHWYACRFNINSQFFQNQLAAMKPFGFDYFVVDAGWYPRVGDWIPDPAKFKPNEFESGLQAIKDSGIPVGIWTCPQYITFEGDEPPAEVDRPGFYRKFINGHLLDMAGTNFPQFMTGHVNLLRERYHIDWWKYDQPFFCEKTRHGKMKNVIALQDSIRTVRKDHPDLYLENCQSGGRIINEFTSLITQSHWIKDGGGNGVKHARQNLQANLGALSFLFPWSVHSWCNNISQMDENDEELLRYYCRSAMAGVWGISDDLSKLSPKHKKILLKEIEYYRYLNKLKQHCLYELLIPENDLPLAYVVYYDPSGSKASLIMYRWDSNTQVDIPIPLPMTFLHKENRFRITNIDTLEKEYVQGEILTKGGYMFQIKQDRLSTIYDLQSIHN